MDYLPDACARLHSLATRDPRRAVQLAARAYHRVPPEQSELRAWAAYTLGVGYLAWERPSAALPLLLEALDRFQNIPLPLATLMARAMLLRQRYLAGTDEDLQPPLAALAREAAQNDHLLLAAQIRLIQIAHLNILGRPDDALALCASIQPIIVANGSPSERAQHTRLSAMAACDRGELDLAAATLEVALQGFKHIREAPGVVRCLFDRAWINQRRERYEVALVDLNRAQLIAERLDLPLRIAFCEKNRGAALTDLGRYDEAFRASLRASALFLSVERHDYAASCDLNMGNIAYYCGLFELAEAAYERAHRVYRQYRMVRMEAASQRNRALALRARGEPMLACHLLEQLLHDTRFTIDVLERAEVYFELARCFVDLNQDDKAEEHWSHAEALFATYGNLPAIAQCQLERAWLMLARDSVHDAQRLLLANQSQLIEQPIHHWRVMYGLGRCAELQGHLSLALTHYYQAITTVTALRQRLASEHASGGIFAQAQQLFTDSLRLTVRCGDQWATLSISEFQRSLALSRQLQQSYQSYEPPPAVLMDALATAQLQLFAATSPPRDEALRAYTEILLRVRHSHPSTQNQLFDPESWNLKALRKGFVDAFEEDWTVLAYVHVDTDLLIITLDTHALIVEHCAFSVSLQRALERTCQPRFRSFTYLDLPYHDGSRAEPWADLAFLGTQLIPASVQARLHPNHRLIIVPAGPLHVLPWSALRVNDSWLCEQCIPQLLPSIHIWPTLTQRSATGTTALLMGIGDFNGRAPHLPNAIAAVDLVEQHWPAEVVRMEATAATRAALLALSAHGELRRYRHLFLATHGQLVAASGLLAHLKFVDHDLLYNDIAQLQLEGALVVLAACDGALGELLPGEEVLSLSRAFLSAGAQDVIASMWSMYDSTILDLLEPLYVALASGCDAPSALAHAQRQLIQSAHTVEDPLVGLPFVWGGMSAYGSGITTIATDPA